MKKIVEYFAQKPIIANVIMFGVIVLAISLWGKIGKEERPEFAYNWVRVSIIYPGASARDVELFVVRVVEEQLKGVTSLYEVSSKSAFGRANFSITLDPNTENESEKIQEIKDAVDRADLPSEVEDPTYDRYTSSQKAIIDIALYLEGNKILTVKQRQRLQEYALTFKNRLLSLREISGVEQNGYLKPELQIKVDPKKLDYYEIPMSTVSERIKSQHLQTPLGIMENKQESEVSLFSYLDNVEALNSTIVRNNFQQSKVYLNQVAQVTEGFERTTAIRKVQGHEAIVFNAQKSSNIGILDARASIIKLVQNFRRINESSSIKIKLLDDESYDIRNRLSLIDLLPNFATT